MNKLLVIALIVELVIGGALSLVPINRGNGAAGAGAIEIPGDSPLAAPSLHTAVHVAGYAAMGAINTFLGGPAGAAATMALTGYTEILQYVFKPEGRTPEEKDVLANVLGAGLGILAYYAFKNRDIFKRPHPQKIRRLSSDRQTL